MTNQTEHNEWLTAGEAAAIPQGKGSHAAALGATGQSESLCTVRHKASRLALSHRPIWTPPFWNLPCYHPNRHPCALPKGWINEKGSTAQNRKCSVRQTT